MCLLSTPICNIVSAPISMTVHFLPPQLWPRVRHTGASEPGSLGWVDSIHHSPMGPKGYHSPLL